MSTFLEIMGTLTLRDAPEVWDILGQLEQDLFTDCGNHGVTIEVTEQEEIEANFDCAGECGMTSGTRIENDLDRLSEYTVRATYLTMGWDNERDREFFGPAEEVAQLKSELALEEIRNLKKQLTAPDARQAAYFLLEA